MIRFFAVVALVVVFGFLGGIWYLTLRPVSGDDRFAQCRTTSIAGGKDTIGGPFELVDGTGRTVSDADVITEPTILYFGYTFCPDVCPFDAARNADAVDLLAERGYSTTPVFVSIDPERDTPDVVGAFAENMHDKMIGLTGSIEQVRAASKAYKTFFNKQEGDEDYYLVSHSTLSYLVLPEYGFVDFFRRDATAEQIAQRTACFIDKS